jgi:hypothetical protein
LSYSQQPRKDRARLILEETVLGDVSKKKKPHEQRSSAVCPSRSGEAASIEDGAEGENKNAPGSGGAGGF